MFLEKQIVNHPNLKSLLLDILNENASFLYEVFSGMKLWKTREEAKKNLKGILEAFLLIQSTIKPTRESYKEFLNDKATIYTAIDYLYKTFREKNGVTFDVNLIALWVALDRKEWEFEEFLKIYSDKEGQIDFDLTEALIAFFVYCGKQ